LTTGAHVFDDYAHHPTEIRNTLKAIKGMYPKMKLHVFFQPHTYSRTKTLLTDFSTAFADADSVNFLPIYASLREEPDLSVSSELLQLETKKHHRAARAFASASDMVEYINESHFKNDSILIFMGAGDLYKLTENLSFRKLSDEYR